MSCTATLATKNAKYHLIEKKEFFERSLITITNTVVSHIRVECQRASEALSSTKRKSGNRHLGDFFRSNISVPESTRRLCPRYSDTQGFNISGGTRLENICKTQTESEECDTSVDAQQLSTIKKVLTGMMT